MFDLNSRRFAGLAGLAFVVFIVVQAVFPFYYAIITSFKSGTGFWDVGASLTQTLFDAGALLHRYKAADAALAATA